jgi:hypothetical protein
LSVNVSIPELPSTLRDSEGTAPRMQLGRQCRMRIASRERVPGNLYLEADELPDIGDP